MVPVGELEYWLSDSGISASRKKKWAWANEAAEFIRTNQPQQGDIWEFMEAVWRLSNRAFQLKSGALPFAPNKRMQLDQAELSR